MYFEVERAGREEGDVNLSNGVDWMPIILIADSKGRRCLIW